MIEQGVMALNIRVDVRKKFFTMQLLRHWLSSDAVDAPSLGVFQPRLDRDLTGLM